MDPEAWGVLPGHHHVDGSWVDAPAHGVEAALAAMGAHDGPPPDPGAWVVRQQAGLHVPFAATLALEDGTSRAVEGWLGPDALPLGYHRLVGDASSVDLIVSPGCCPLPDRTWGLAVQLYAARSRASWGIGDLRDLVRLRELSPLTLINPLHAVAPAGVQQASPYFPASRRWRNPLYLAVDDPALDAAGRALNRDRRIDRDAVWRLKRQALWSRFSSKGGSPGFDDWVAAQGPGLHEFAVWSALAESMPSPEWPAWPEPLRDPASPDVAAWGAANATLVTFHAWLQWLIVEQLAGIDGLVTDLAIGADPCGFDAWRWQGILAPGVTVGAPSDDFCPPGQDWGFPPFDPWRLRAAAYRPFVEVVRAALEHGAGVRVDHAAGLFRLFWVPAGLGPTEGVYVRYPWEDLLNIVALEAHRAGAFVVGEDLGTVDPFVRSALAEWGVLSYKVLWFEDEPPQWWPERALAAMTTHDLPTAAGLLSGSDQRARASIGMAGDPATDARVLDRLVAVGGTPDTAREAIAASPCLVATATLEDALEVEERPNMPGTIDEWPNWSLALPVAVDDLASHPGVAATRRTMGAGRA